jgi:hypothetical protein
VGELQLAPGRALPADFPTVASVVIHSSHARMKQPIHAAIAVACLSMLAGCLTPAQVAERQRMQQDLAQDKTCRDWRLKPGTDAYANCRLELSRQQLAGDITAQQAADQAMAERQRSNAQAIQALAPHSCMYNSMTLGGMTNGLINC